jgi:hypothetical protein
MNVALLFFSQFICVLLLVVQSINNNHGRMWLGAFTSIGIGLAQLAAYRLLPDASIGELTAFVMAGPAGNIVAQWIKRKDISRIVALREPMRSLDDPSWDEK